MSEENQAKLLQAYQYAVQAGQDGIAELLQDVILGEMAKERKPVQRVSAIERGIDIANQQSCVATWTGIDPMSKETTV